MFRRFLSLIEVQYLLVVLQRLRLRSIFVSVPRARPECGQIAMLIRDGRRRNGSAARGRGRMDGVARSAQWPHSVARFMGEIANRDGNLAIEKGGISVGRRQQSCCRSRTILCNVEKQRLYFSLFCACVPMQSNGLTYMYSGGLKLCSQVWRIVFLLVLTTSASICLQHSRNLGMVIYPNPVPRLR